MKNSNHRIKRLPEHNTKISFRGFQEFLWKTKPVRSPPVAFCRQGWYICPQFFVKERVARKIILATFRSFCTQISPRRRKGRHEERFQRLEFRETRCRKRKTASGTYSLFASRAIQVPCMVLCHPCCWWTCSDSRGSQCRPSSERCRNRKGRREACRFGIESVVKKVVLFFSVLKILEIVIQITKIFSGLMSLWMKTLSSCR